MSGLSGSEMEDRQGVVGGGWEKAVAVIGWYDAWHVCIRASSLAWISAKHMRIVTCVRPGSLGRDRHTRQWSRCRAQTTISHQSRHNHRCEQRYHPPVNADDLKMTKYEYGKIMCQIKEAARWIPYFCLWFPRRRGWKFSRTDWPRDLSNWHSIRLAAGCVRQVQLYTLEEEVVVLVMEVQAVMGRAVEWAYHCGWKVWRRSCLFSSAFWHFSSSIYLRATLQKYNRS